MAARYENLVEDTRHIVAVKKALLGVLWELFPYSEPESNFTQMIHQSVSNEDCLELDAGDAIGITKKAIELFEELNCKQVTA